MKTFVLVEKQFRNSACINSACSIYCIGIGRMWGQCNQLIKWAWLEVITQ